MELSDCGSVADQQFEWLQYHFPYVEVPIRVVMPDHIHAIIRISRRQIDDYSVRTGRDPSPRDAEPPLSGMKIKPLPELIGAYKTTTSKKIHQAGYTRFRWQRSYYEHIIRDLTDFGRVYNYIHNNPAKYPITNQS